MAKQAKARLDAKGLTALGLDKLIDILLEESVANKALKARLMAALAGTSGPEEIARLIDKWLDAIESARTSINGARARDLAVELSGLVRNIQSELGGVDATGGLERLVRVMALRPGVERRLKADSARLAKVFAEVEAAIAGMIPTLPDDEQLRIVPVLERERRKDRHGERSEFYGRLIPMFGVPAAQAWQALLESQLRAGDPAPAVPRLLQRLYVHNGNLDGYIELEKAKPENRQDTLTVARMLHVAGRQQEALDWVRKTYAGTRILFVNGIHASVGPDYEAGERRLLAADILDAIKERDAAQALRWQAFLEAFDPAILRRYIARLDDFAEFDEMDKAFAAVMTSGRHSDALRFLLAWPRTDLAARYVLEHGGAWMGRDSELLVRAAQAFEQDFPLASTLLYRILVRHVLEHGLTSLFEAAVGWLRTLAMLAAAVPEDSPIPDHAAYVFELKARFPRRPGFWSRLSQL